MNIAELIIYCVISSALTMAFFGVFSEYAMYQRLLMKEIDTMENLIIYASES
jgi:hypothetical protein